MKKILLPASSTFSDHIADYLFSDRDVIGTGSFGKVFKAICTTNNSPCAIKRLSKCSNHGDRRNITTHNLYRIENEVKVHQGLNHRHIIDLYRVLEDSQYVYLVLELCEGGSLKALLKTAAESRQDHLRHINSRQPVNVHENDDRPRYRDTSPLLPPDLSEKLEPILPWNFIRAVFRQVCDGLAYLHRRNIVHRDLNINNLLLKSPVSLDSSSCIANLEVKIADFGLALDQRKNQGKTIFVGKEKLQGKSGSTICGTPGFISPEVWRQTEPVSPASDIFSLGSILYSLVTGVTSPKGDLNLNKFPAELAHLISNLLHEKPSNRLPLKEVIRHPFTLGPIITKRLSPVTKRMDDMLFSISADGTVTMQIDSPATESHLVSTPSPSYEMRIAPGSESIVIQRKHRHNRFTIANLPQREWKKYLCAFIFVEMVRGLSPKVTIRCKGSSRFSSIDEEGRPFTIEKGSLMENGTFEMTVRDDSRRVTNKLRLDSKLKSHNLPLFQHGEKLLKHALKLESTMELLEERSQMDCFPLKIGKPLTVNPNVITGSIVSPNRTGSSATSSATSTSFNVLRSVTIDKVGIVNDLSDGIEVKFTDGSNVFCGQKRDNLEIVYSSPTCKPTKFTPSQCDIPDEIRQKLHLILMAIQTLKKSSSPHQSPPRSNTPPGKLR